MNTGFLLIDKPEDWTSHDVVGYLRGVTQIRKIGHAGTLDPFATGLLIVAVSREATKRIDEFHAFKKEYIARVKLGSTSNTQDKTGTVLEMKNKSEKLKNITQENILEVLEKFVGEQEQIPPMFSAKKIKGQKLYELARKGIEVERQPNTITISEIELLKVEGEFFDIRVVCSTGTYIRTLCHDIGQKLGVGALCEELRRTSIGNFSVEDAVGPKELMSDNWEERLISPGVLPNK